MKKSNYIDVFFHTLATKITTACRAKVRLPGQKSSTVTNTNTATPVRTFPPLSRNVLDTTIIAIGASTGGTEATLAVLKKLPANIPGMVITQHMPEGFTAMYAERLNRICQMEVREAKNGDMIRPGLALIAPGALQMEVVSVPGGYSVKCYPGEKISGHRPSVDCLFNSIAQNVGIRKVGIIMTGMGRDGADGLLRMRQKGAYTIGQDKESCVVYGMPMVAYNIGAVCTQASLEHMPAILMKHLKG